MPSDAFSTASCGFSLTPEAAAHVEQAARVYSDGAAAEKELLAAIAASPDCLGAYFSLYKFYFYQYRLGEAVRAARMAMDIAARQGGFDADWHRLTPASSDWAKVDSPAHFYLFTLKALAFMHLRLDKGDEAMAMLAKLFELDPQDSVGASVIRDLAGSVETAPAAA
ncbi:MAG: hypothetical protein K8F27_07020 [Sulfuricellaceae bacterium]|nr:hypothetical protein [Sulfuricellaceae bacterium]